MLSNFETLPESAAASFGRPLKAAINDPHHELLQFTEKKRIDKDRSAIRRTMLDEGVSRMENKVGSGNLHHRDRDQHDAFVVHEPFDGEASHFVSRTRALIAPPG